MNLTRTALAVAAGYALGSLPSADLANRLASSEADLRARGSHNPGALNAGKELGKGWGAAVLALDTGKGATASALGRLIGGPSAANLAATAAVVGHCHPPGQRRGGKGVATSIGQVVGTYPRYLVVDIAVGVVTAALPRWSQRTWAATATASMVWVGSSAVAWRRGWSTGIDDPAPAALPIAAAVSSLVIAHRFAQNPLVDGRPRSS